MWRIYRHSRKDEDYTNYKEALNAAMTEIRKYERSYGYHNNTTRCLVEEDLNGLFSSVFTKEDISSLPVPDAKLQEAKSDFLWQ